MELKLNEFIINRQKQIAEIIKCLLGRKIESLQDQDYDFWESQNVTIEIGEFDNCRESGYTYSIVNSKQDMVFCVYEHRNSDQIIINGCMRKDIKPYGPYNGTSKYDYLFSYSYNEYEDVANKLAEFLLQSYKGTFNETILKECSNE